MKKTKYPITANLPASLQIHLDGLNEKYARKLEKAVLKIVKKMSQRYADLLDKEVHAAAARKRLAPGAAAAKPKKHRWTNL